MSQESAKDLVIKRLKQQLEKYKSKVENMSFDNLSSKITELEAQIAQKDELIGDLKETAQIDDGSGPDAQQVKAKMIVLQSKLRKMEKEISQLNSENENLKRQLKRSEKSSANNQEVDVLKRQLKQEMEASDRLRQQINRLSTESGSKSPALQKRVKQLEMQLEDVRRSKAGSGGSGVSSAEILEYKNEIKKLHNENKELKNQLGDFEGDSGGPMASIRLKREIANLQSQISLLKKDNEQMQKKYESLVRKQEFDFEDGW